MSDKQGNANFVCCPSCGEWYNVGGALLEARVIDLVCPYCEHRFKPAEARDVVTPS